MRTSRTIKEKKATKEERERVRKKLEDAGVELAIRKLTPTECLRLMDVSAEDIDTMTHSGVSNSQLYRQAGNSIVVAVLEKIMYNLFSGKREKRKGELTIFDFI